MMTLYKYLSITFILILSLSINVSAQITKPNPSPRVELKQQIGLANISLDYGRPSARDRQIFGALIPYGKIWRAGANASTKFTLDRAISIKGNQVPEGTYAIYVIPAKKEWTIIISKNTKLWGAGGYDDKDDLVRFNAPISKLKDKQESFRIDFENFHANGADMYIAWENTKVILPIFIDSDAEVFKEITEKVVNAKGEVKAGTYYDAGSFYFEKNKDLPQAAKWVEKAMELRPKAFWYVYKRAEIALALNDKVTAKAMAEKSLKMAKASAHDYGYIAKNELLLAKIK